MTVERDDEEEDLLRVEVSQRNDSPDFAGKTGDFEPEEAADSLDDLLAKVTKLQQEHSIPSTSSSSRSSSPKRLSIRGQSPPPETTQLSETWLDIAEPSSTADSAAKKGRVIDPETGRQLGLAEAVRKGLLAASDGGKFVDPLTGEKVDFSEAAAKGYIDPELAQLLTANCGVPDPDSDSPTGKQLSLLEAVDKGLFDLDRGVFVDPESGRALSVGDAVKAGLVLKEKVSAFVSAAGFVGAMAAASPAGVGVASLVQVIRSGMIDADSGKVKMQGKKSCSVKDALNQGVIGPNSSSSAEPNVDDVQQGISLSDALKMGLVESGSGKIVDRFSGECVPITDAITRGLLNPNRLEVFNPEDSKRISLEAAIKAEIIDESKGTYKTKTGSQVEFSEAVKKNFIANPLTLKECDDFDLIEKDNKIRDPVTKRPLSLLAAIGVGILDIDLKSVRDVKSGELVTLQEAIKRGIVDADKGHFRCSETDGVLSLGDAVKKGHLTTVGKKSIFDIEGLQDQQSGDYISFNTALDRGVILGKKVVEKKTGGKLSFADAAEKGLIQAQLVDMLNKTVGIKDFGGREMTLLEAVGDGKVDPNSGLPIDPKTKKTVPFEKAIEKGLISASGAAVLKSLLNITVTTATVTQTVKRYINVSAEEGEGAVTFDEAIRRGLIDESSGVFTHPDTGKQLAVDEAANLGLIKIKSSSSSASSRHSSFRSTSIKGLGSSNNSSRGQSPDKNAGRKDSAGSNASRKTSTSGGGGGSRKSASKRVSSFEREQQQTSSSSFSYSSSSEVVSSSSARHVPIRVEKNGSSHHHQKDEEIVERKASISSPEIPAQGFTLKEAMDRELLDATKGIFKMTETSSPINFAQSIDQGLIDAKSASVIVNDETPPMSLQKALDQKVLDECGNFNDARRTYTMQQAVRTGRVKHVRKGGQRTASRSSSVVDSDSDFVQVHERIRIRKLTGQFEVHPDVTPTDLLQALQEGKLRPSDIMVKNPKRENTTVNVLEAIRSGMINKSTGEYTTHEGKTLNIVDAIKYGFVTFMGTRKDSESPNGNLRSGKIHARIVESGVTTTTLSSFMVEVPGTGEEIKLEEAVRRGLVSEETAKLYKEEVSTDSKVESTVVLITDPETGEELPSEEAIAKGIVSREEVEEFVRMKDQEATAKTTKKPAKPGQSSPRRLSSPRASPGKTSPSPQKAKSPSPQKSPRESPRITPQREPTPKKKTPPPVPEKPKKSAVGKSPEPPPSLSKDSSVNGGSSSKQPARKSVSKKPAEKERPKTLPTKSKSPSPKKTSPISPSSKSSSGAASPVKDSPSLSRSSSQRRKKRKDSSSSSSTSSSSSSASDLPADQDSYRSEMTIEIDRGFDVTEERTVTKQESASHTVRTCIVNLKPGYALSSLNEVRNLSSGETMTVYEAKLRGIATDVKDNKAEYVTERIQVFVSEAVDKGLVDFSQGTFTNPANGQTTSIGEAVKLGLLITDLRQQEEVIQLDSDSPSISLTDAFQHCFDAEKRLFRQNSTEEEITLEEAVQTEWINGKDIVFDVASDKQSTLQEAIEEGVIDGKTCEYTVLSTKEKMFILDAAKKGLVAVFPEPVPELELSDVTYTLQETFDNGVYNRTSDTFYESSSQQQITVIQALKIGLIDFRSAEVKDVKSGKSFNLLEAVSAGVIDKKTGKYQNAVEKREMSLMEAYEQDLLVTLERQASPFECITLWEAIDRQQLDVETGLFYSIHEENKKMPLEEAIYRKYIDKKSAFVKDTWKRKYCSLSEASRKKIIKDGRIMNTTTGKYLTVREAINLEIIVREIRAISLIEALDFGMYLPHSGTLDMPGFEREITLREAIEFKLIDHTKTIIKNRKSNRFVTTLEALRTGEIDGNSGLYNGDMNLLEARSLGYLLTSDAMVRRSAAGLFCHVTHPRNNNHTTTFRLFCFISFIIIRFRLLNRISIVN